MDAVLFSSAVLAIPSALYFLFLPSGGFKGGRNPLYNIQILFSRHAWDDLHTWSGVAMIAAAVIHLALHWRWVVSMGQRTWKEVTGKGTQMNSRGRWNLILNTVVVISFVLTAISGVYFMFFPGGRLAVDTDLLFSRTTWDFIHTWAGVLFIVAIVIHFANHWRWVVNVTRKIFHQTPALRLATQTVNSLD